MTDLDSGYPLAYTLKPEQITALVTMSTIGYQYISYQCTGVLVWLSDSTYGDK